MFPVEETYGDRFFARRHKLHWRAPIVLDALQFSFDFKSMIDVGCATGDLVAEAAKRGVKAWGVEGSECSTKYAVSRNIVIADLRLRESIVCRLPLNKFDLCICFEVAEHIDSDYCHIFLSHLVNFSDVVVISAAPPGQKGVGHVNCREEKYWTFSFRIFKYFKDDKKTEELKSYLYPWRHKDGIKAYYNNLFVMRRYHDRYNDDFHHKA